MILDPRPPREFDGKGRTTRELLAGRKCSIDGLAERIWSSERPEREAES